MFRYFEDPTHRTLKKNISIAVADYGGSIARDDEVTRSIWRFPFLNGRATVRYKETDREGFTYLKIPLAGWFPSLTIQTQHALPLSRPSRDVQEEGENLNLIQQERGLYELRIYILGVLAGSGGVLSHRAETAVRARGAMLGLTSALINRQLGLVLREQGVARGAMLSREQRTAPEKIVLFGTASEKIVSSGSALAKTLLSHEAQACVVALSQISSPNYGSNLLVIQLQVVRDEVVLQVQKRRMDSPESLKSFLRSGVELAHALLAARSQQAQEAAASLGLRVQLKNGVPMLTGMMAGFPVRAMTRLSQRAGQRITLVKIHGPDGLRIIHKAQGGTDAVRVGNPIVDMMASVSGPTDTIRALFQGSGLIEPLLDIVHRHPGSTVTDQGITLLCEEDEEAGDLVDDVRRAVHLAQLLKARYSAIR